MKANSFIPIDVLSAEVSTATIEIKTLTIGRKQVTLAVFRQLDQEVLVDPRSSALYGVPWGRVNYCPSKACAGEGGHLHVVWQKGIELRRATVSRWWTGRNEAASNRLDDRQRICDEDLDPYLLALLANGQSLPPIHDRQPVDRATWTPLLSASMTIEGVTFNRPSEVHSYIEDELIPWSGEVRHALQWGPYGELDREGPAQALVEMNIAPDGVDDALVETLRQNLYAKLETYKAAVRADKACEAAYAARYAELEALPLLFIAV
jgi:hypothetical protein